MSAMTNDPAAAASRGFHVESRHEADGALIVTCVGRLVYENAPMLRDEIRKWIPTQKRIVLDLKEVPSMDSSGLGAIAGLYVSGRTHGCKIEMINSNKAVRDLFSMSNLLALFEPTGRYVNRMP